MCTISGGSRNFKTGGRGSGAVEFLGFGGLFWCPLHTYPMFCSECRDQSTYCKHCMMATIKVYAYYTVRIYKNKPPTNFKQGGAHPARRCCIRLWYLIGVGSCCKSNFLVTTIGMLQAHTFTWTASPFSEYRPPIKSENAECWVRRCNGGEPVSIYIRSNTGSIDRHLYKESNPCFHSTTWKRR